MAARIRSSKYRKAQQLLLRGVLVVGGAYAGYKIYNSSLWSKARQQLRSLEEACTALSQAAKGSGDVVHLVSSELEAFLQSDSDEIPRSIRQLLKIAASREFQQSAAALSGSLTKGVVVATQGRSSMSKRFSVQKCIHGGDADWNGIDYDSILQAEAAAPYMSDMCMCDGPEEQGVVDKVMDKMFTKAGRGFASAVVGTVVRDLMTAYLESGKGAKAGEDSGPAQQTFTESVFDMACTEKGRALVTDCVTTLIVNAVTVFLDKTADVNVYDEMLASMSKPGNREQVHDLIGTVANSAIDTLVRTSHDVLTGERPSRPPASALRERTASLPTPMLEPRALWPEEKAGDGEDAEASPSVFDFPVVAGRKKGLESRAEPAAAGDGEGLQIADGERLRSSTVVGASRRGAPAGDDGYSWLHQLFQTMIDPRNRRLLMDVTGVAAYEAIRALIAGLHDVLWRSAGSGRRQGEGAPGMGAAVVSASRMVDDYFRAIAAKALVCVTICLALCLNMVSGVAYP